jgi:hypothetical protein
VISCQVINKAALALAEWYVIAFSPIATPITRGRSKPYSEELLILIYWWLRLFHLVNGALGDVLFKS